MTEGVSGPALTRPARLGPWWLALLVFLLHLLPTGGHLQSPDEELLYRMSEGFAFRFSSSVEPLEYDRTQGMLLVPEGQTFATRRGRDRSFYAQYLPLQPLLATPLLWAARATEPLLADRFAKVQWPTMAGLYHDGSARERWQRGVLVLFFNPIVSALTALVLVRIGERLTGSRRAGLTTAVLWAVGTIGWAHSKTFFTEPLAGLLALLALESLHRFAQHREIRAALLCGAWLALGNWVRVDGPFISAGVLLVMGWLVLRNTSTLNARALVPLVIAGSLAAGAFLVLQGYNARRIGSSDLTAGYSHQSEGVKFTTPLLVGLHGLLMTPGKGLFFFSPAAVLTVWGWCIARRRGVDGVDMMDGVDSNAPLVPSSLILHPSSFRFHPSSLFLLPLLPFSIAMATWQNWDGGWCWGPRHIVQIHPALMVGTAFLFRKPIGSVARILGVVIGALGAAVQLFGTSQSPLDYYTEYYRTLHDGVYHRTAYREGELLTFYSKFRLVDAATGAPVSALETPSPMVNTLYLPQESQWASYPDLWRGGFCDWYFWRAVFPRETPDLWSQEP